METKDLHIKMLDEYYNDANTRLFKAEREIRDLQEEVKFIRGKYEEQLNIDFDLELSQKKYHDLYARFKK